MLKPERSLTCVSAEDLAAPETLNLMASIERAAGGACAGFALLPALDPLTLATKRSLVLLIIDGLGSEYLAHASPGGPLSNNRLCDLRSVCPATTAVALTDIKCRS